MKQVLGRGERDWEQDWGRRVPLLSQAYTRELLAELEQRRARETVYPEPGQVFYALQTTPFEAVSVVILGQDPYHGPGQAHGLAFSVPRGVTAPPSLRNIFKEIRDDIYAGEPREFDTDLSRWAAQGVLLLNTTLSVADGRPGSHARLGWARLTDAIIQSLSERREHLVFMLWGRHAQSKKALIDERRHLVLETVHPSPLSAKRGFFGCRHFSRANRYLLDHGRAPIHW